MKKDEKPKYKRMPQKKVRTDFSREWATKRAFFCDVLGMDDNQLTETNIEAIRCKGRDNKESLMVRRIMQRETEWLEAGYYIDFYEVCSMTQKRIARVGPFEEEQDSIDAYNEVIRRYGFRRDLLIGMPDELDPDLDWGEDENEDEWGEIVVPEIDNMDWDEGDPDDPNSMQYVDPDDEIDWDTDEEDDDDGWS